MVKLHVSGNIAANTISSAREIVLAQGASVDIESIRYGTLYVSMWSSSGAGSRTDRVYHVNGWWDSLAYTVKETSDGTTTSWAYTVTSPSGFTTRITNTGPGEAKFNYFAAGL